MPSYREAIFVVSKEEGQHPFFVKLRGRDLFLPFWAGPPKALHRVAFRSSLGALLLLLLLLFLALF